MPLEHASLTGGQLHEPKGIETAVDGTVYVANGVGSGVWSDPLSPLLTPNLYSMEQRFDDLATAGSIYFNVPYKSQLRRLNVVTYGAVDADTLVTIYINGVLFADSLTLVAAGSGAGQRQSLVVTTANTITAETLVTITSAGTATASVRGEVQLELEAVA